MNSRKSLNQPPPRGAARMGKTMNEFHVGLENGTVRMVSEAVFGNNRWWVQVISPIRLDAVHGIMDDQGNWQEILRGRVIMRQPGAWW